MEFNENDIKTKKTGYESHLGKKILFICLFAIIILFFYFMGKHTPDDFDNPSEATSTSESPDVSTADETNETADSGETPNKVIKGIAASYEGSTKAGTKLNYENGDIIVNINYDDGTSETTYDYEVENPTTLKAGKKSTIKITYENFQCSLSIKCTSTTPTQYKKQCKKISYKKLSRNPDKYDGKKVTFTGQIIQVMESDYGNAYRINVSKTSYGSWDDTVYVEFDPSTSKRLLEDDIVKFYGTYEGIYTYETIFGGEVSIPSVDAKYMKLIK